MWYLCVPCWVGLGISWGDWVSCRVTSGLIVVCCPVKEEVALLCPGLCVSGKHTCTCCCSGGEQEHRVTPHNTWIVFETGSTCVYFAGYGYRFLYVLGLHLETCSCLLLHLHVHVHVLSKYSNTCIYILGYPLAILC